MNIKQWIKENTQDLTNKTVVITGATGGIGMELCLYLVRLNANLILACRNRTKTEALINKLKDLNNNINISFIELNLEDMENVKIFVNKLKDVKFDFLIHNAGIYNVPRKTTNAGIDNIFQVNFVAPYFITKELLPTLRINKTKVIAVSSIAYNYSQTDENDIEFKTRKKASEIYGNSKRYFTFSLNELFKNETKTQLCITHPGVTLTNITNHYHWSINWLVKLGIKLFFPNAPKATLSILAGLFTNCDNLEWIGPKTFKVWGKPTKQKLTNINENEINKIFEIAEIYYKQIKSNI